MTITDRLRAWLGALHEFRTNRYLARHSKHAGAQSTKEAQR